MVAGTTTILRDHGQLEAASPPRSGRRGAEAQNGGITMITQDPV
jgi:hypothetical protein